MTSFIDPLIAFVSSHAWLAYLVLFLAALLEAVPIVGSVVPGSTIILALSALVPVEVVFSIPGLGQLAWNAAMNRDLPVLLAVTMIMAVAVTFAGMTADGTGEWQRA